MNSTRRLFSLTAITMLACCLGGCITFFEKEYVHVPDPEARSFRFVDEVRGNVLVLHGGDRLELKAIHVDGMSEFQRERLGRVLQRLAPYPGERRSKKEIHPGLLVGDPSGSDVLLSTFPQMYRMFCGFPAIRLFPIRVEVTPQRFDLVELALAEGLAKLNENAVSDPVRLDRYRKAQDYAKHYELGIWASPGAQLQEAAAEGNAAEARRLLDAGVPVDFIRGPQAAKSEMAPPFPALYAWSRGRGSDAPTPLIAAIRYGQLEMVKLLLERGANPNLPQGTSRPAMTQPSICLPPDGPMRPLRYAIPSIGDSAEHGLAMVRLLVSAGADVRAADAEGPLITYHLLESGQWELVDLLRAKGAVLRGFDPKTTGTQLLASAASYGNADNLRRLIELGADADGLAPSGAYPLSVAASAGYVDVARLLLNAGADPNRKDTKGKTPLQYAKAKSYNRGMVELLKSRGAK